MAHDDKKEQEVSDKLVQLPSGRALQIEVDSGAQERITVRGRGGGVEISIRLTDEGPRLLVDAADLELRASGSIALRCDRFDVQARVAAAISAPDTLVEATIGDLELRANDNVALEGEQIRMNCDRPDEPPDWMKRQLKAATAPTLPASDLTGDAALAEQMIRQKKDLK